MPEGIILGYHNIVKDKIQSLYDVKLKEFEKQLLFLKKRGYTFLKLDQLKEENIKNLQKWVILSFDDGFQNLYKYVFPLLNTYKITGHFFIVPLFIEKVGFMNWRQVREISQTHIIGSHGLTHQILPLLSKEELIQEVRDSKKIIYEHINKDVKYFSIPRGWMDKRLYDLLIENNYVFCLTSKFDFTKKIELFLPRITLKADTSLDKFKKILEKKLLFYKIKFGEMIKYFFKKTCPYSYENVRKKIYPQEYTGI